MEALRKLEEKITLLIDLVKKIKKENAGLVDENAQLTKKLCEVEEAYLHDAKDAGNFEKERQEAKKVVDSLIKSIDTFVEQEK